MSRNAEDFDGWIRSSFVEMNSELEALYFARPDRANVSGVGDDIKARIRDEGRAFIVRLVDEGNTDEGFDNAFNLLGNLGLYMASLRRHELTNPAREEKSPHREASALGMHIAASLGVAPRFATSHLGTHNYAVDGRMRTFTDLEDEFIFIEYNTIGILAFKRAADALKRILPLGVSSPVSAVLLENAASALRDVIDNNDVLYDKLDVDRFFYSVRPYYKPYRVGRHEYRGANAGDFSGINEIDLLLGLCNANDPYYSQLLVDKMLYMTPEDQASLRDCMRRRSLLAQFLDALPEAAGAPWFKRNGAAFLEVCRLHGRTAAQHHDRLVKSFISEPSQALPEENLKQVTASGPPLPVLLNALEVLRDMRLAAPRDDIRTSHRDIAALSEALGAS